MARTIGDLTLGVAVVERLIPHRPPMLFVDRVEGYISKPPPTLRASRCLTAGEPYFAGHFPGAPVMPGALLLEGLAQTAALLSAIERLVRRHEAAGGEASAVLAALAELDRAARFEADVTGGQQTSLSLISAAPTPGMLAASDLKFVRPAFPGDQVVYEARLVREVGRLASFEVEAEARGQLLTKGTLSLARVGGDAGAAA